MRPTRARRFAARPCINWWLPGFLYNPDNPARPVNSPKAVYQIEPDTLKLLRTFGTAAWVKNLAAYMKNRMTLAARYARAREMQKLPVKLATGETMRLSPGKSQ